MVWKFDDVKAKELLYVFNNWSVFYKSNFETVNLIDIMYLEKILKNKFYKVNKEDKK